MKKYCFIADKETGLVQLGIGCTDEYYTEIGMVERDVEQSEKNGLWYLTERCPHYTEDEKLQIAKEDKIAFNNKLRDNTLLGGIKYKDVLFDSDTDQKINLLSTVETLTDEDTIVWYGMNNEPLLCNKEDLYNIGYLIKELTTYCWTHNAEIKQAIQNATTLEELEAIEINYNREEE